jgi:hypothetical protein
VARSIDIVRDNEFINCGHSVASQGGSGITPDIENRAQAVGVAEGG